MTLTFSKEKTGPLKAILAIFIVMGHFYYFSDSLIFVLFHKLAATAVAMFFFISGFGLIKSWKKKGSSYLTGFFKQRITRILIPAIILFLIHLMLCGNGGMTFSGILRRLIVQGLAYPPEYWFIFVILFDYLLFWFAFKFLPASIRLPFLFFGSLVFIILTVWAGYDRCWWICSFSFPGGAVYAMYEADINSFCGKNIFVFLSSLVIIFLTAIGIFLTGNQFVWTLFYLVVPFGIALTVAALKPDKVLFPLLGLLGVISYEIYLSHITMMNYFKYSIPIDPEWLYILMVFVSIFVISVIVNRFCALILPRK
jgi:peptidoglycan/LPS O-acetylase OafA/YrhL